MRALRSRSINESDNNEEDNNIKRKKSKKYLSNVSEESTNKSEDQVVKKKSRKSKKKHVDEDINSSTETGIQKVLLNTENSSENDDYSKKRLKKKKLKKSQKKNNISTNAQSTEIETEVSEINQKVNNSFENNENLVQLLKKKSKKGRKSQNEKQIHENSSENDEDSKQYVKKKSKKLKRLKDENNQLTTTTQSNENAMILSTSTEMEEKSIKKKSRYLRSTIVSSPNFNNAVTSTLVKPSRKKILKLNANEIEKNGAKRLTKQKRISESNNSVSNCLEAVAENATLIKIEDNSPIKSRRSSLQFSSKSKIENEDNIFKRSSRRSSLGISSVSTADVSDCFVKSRRSVSFKNRSSSNNLANFQENKISKILLSNVTAGVIAINDSPDISKAKQNTFNKSETIFDEDTLKENCKKAESQQSNSINRRETFNKLPKNKHLIDESIIIISDTPDKTARRNTFSKKEVESDNTFDKSNRPKRSSKSTESTLTKDESIHQTSTKSYSINDTSRTNTFNTKSRASGLSEVGGSILENIIDITETPEKTTTNSVEKNDTYELEANTSGDWKVEQKDKIDENKSSKTNDKKDNQNQQINKTPPKAGPLSQKDQSIRKKWLKFPRHSSDATFVLEQISSPKLQKKMNASLVQKIINTPKELYNIQKPVITPINLSLHNKSVKKTPIVIKKSPLKSVKKSVIGNSSKKSASKRTVMPNFALIHQKAFDKMENLKEYSERKQQRAQALLSSKKLESVRKSVKTTDTKTEEPNVKSSRQLFTNDAKDIKYNRFGFKITEAKPAFSVKPEKNIQIVKPVIKPSVFTRSDVVAIANKKVVTNNRENRRDILKGVRTNRRFELLMQMRNK